ncbi:hypothetical protein MRB56_09250 [Halomonas cupida]|uniref:hypothetical protein n=1 Tax=Halomonas cupida TaxID=44933 RepID=UPI0039B65458
MSTAHDLWKTRDEVADQRADDDLAEEALNLDAELALDAFMNDGFLPGGYDSGDVDAVLMEEMQDCLHKFSHRKSRFELLAHAQEVARRREQIALRFAKEGLRRQRA